MVFLSTRKYLSPNIVNHCINESRSDEEVLKEAKRGANIFEKKCILKIREVVNIRNIEVEYNQLNVKLDPGLASRSKITHSMQLLYIVREHFEKIVWLPSEDNIFYSKLVNRSIHTFLIAIY